MDESPEIDDLDEKLANSYYSDISKRCEGTNVDCQETEDPDGDSAIVLEFPNGRTKRKITFWNIREIKTLLDMPFEHCRFVGDFDAIYLPEDGLIEASVAGLESLWGGRRKLSGSKDDEPIIIESPSASDISMTLSKRSDLFSVLTRWRRSYTLTLTGVGKLTHDESLRLLEDSAYALFLQIEMETGVTPRLRRRRLYPIQRSLRFAAQTSGPLQFPKWRYDHIPMRLYWHACSALEVPLLQFLGFYQCIEYYFPFFAEKGAQNKIRQLLMDPRFRATKDEDIQAIIEAGRRTIKGGMDAEVVQLRKTLQECIDADELKSIIPRLHSDREHFNRKLKGVTDYRIPTTKGNDDIHTAVAKRVYDIRCKVVHAKSDNDESTKPILPFSKEADSLHADIALVKTLAQKVLIACGTEFIAHSWGANIEGYRTKNAVSSGDNVLAEEGSGA